jgi:hypothetical protein
MTQARNLPIIKVFILLLFFIETNVYADAIATPPPPQYGVGFLIMFIILLIISIIVLFAWLAIRSIRKKRKSN